MWRIQPNNPSEIGIRWKKFQDVIGKWKLGLQCPGIGRNEGDQNQGRGSRVHSECTGAGSQGNEPCFPFEAEK